MNTLIHPPCQLAWSTDTVDTADPFQRRWYLQQILTHGTAEDIRRVDLDEVAREIDALELPADIDRLWRTFLASNHG